MIGMTDRACQTRLTRRAFMAAAAAVGAGASLGGPRPLAAQEPVDQPAPAPPVPVIDTTDLYHPHQDVGDNFDLIAAYALPEVDLRAVILDVTEEYRRPTSGDGIARDPGIIPVCQLNSIFGRSVPYATAPFQRMRSIHDPMLDAPAPQQAGVRLLLETLDRSDQPVNITVFGSARPVAVAYNREPDLMRTKTRMIHLCAGATEPGYVEWNAALDPHAFVRLLRSDLPIAYYPCATADGPFAYSEHSCFWLLPDLRFVRQMDPRLQSYLAYAFTRSARPDFLCAMDEPPTEQALASFVTRPHNVWETAIWAIIARRCVARDAEGHFRLLKENEIPQPGTELPNELLPCRLEALDDGQVRVQLTDEATTTSIYYRGDPRAHEAALREALPALYTSFQTGPTPS